MIVPKDREDYNEFKERFVSNRRMKVKYPDIDNRKRKAREVWRKFKVLKDE